MNRSLLFGILFAWLFVITFILSSFIIYDAESGLAVTSGLTNFTGEAGASDLNNGVSMFRTLWGALTFNIEGLPLIFNLFFQVPTAIIGFQILQFLRGN